MFGAVCSGRPMELAQQVEPTKFVFSIPNASNINHIAIFLLPQTEFTDPSFTALVYFQLPKSPEFKLLGGLNPAKPSTIFKLNTGMAAEKNTHALDDDEIMNDSDIAANADQVVLNIGISIEPTAQAEVLLQQSKASQKTILPPHTNTPTSQPVPTSSSEIAQLANKIVKHAYNYLGGFIDSSGKVPMKVFDTWWDKFRMKLSNNPNFLNELD